MQTGSDYIIQVEEFVTELLNDLPEELCYHNLKHTREVVHAGKILAEKSGLSASDTEIIIISAWFHDVGHIITYFGHEKAGSQIAKNFLRKIKYPIKKIEKVVNCIMATCYPPNPNNELQRVLCDADMYHLSMDDYENRSAVLRKELEMVTSTKIPHKIWCDKNIEFLNDHCYFTKYGKKVLHLLKEKNIKEYFSNHFC